MRERLFIIMNAGSNRNDNYKRDMQNILDNTGNAIYNLHCEEEH